MPKVAFTQRDVQALIRAAKAEGCEHPSVDILPGGGLRNPLRPLGGPKWSWPPCPTAATEMEPCCSG